MYETGKLAQVTAEMRRYGLHILGIRESHWTGSGRLRTATGETLIYSGREDNQHRGGVAIILKKGLEKCLMEWKPINSRMMTLRLRGKHTNTSIIQCYAPTNDSEDESKDYFYEQQQRELTSIPRHDLIVVMGDLNAKVGEDNTNYERTMGQHGTGTRNENGERLVDFCALNNLVIGGTLFPHRTIHKLTWNYPNGRDKNQIDHLVIGGMWRRSLQDVKVRRGADVGSDHHLVTARIKLKLKKTFTREATRTRFNVHTLNDGNVRSAFRLELKNRFQALQDLEETTPNTDEVNTQWKHIVEAYTENSKTCLGVKKKNANKEWIQQGTWTTIEERREIKKRQLAAKSIRLQEKYAQDYKEACQKVKRLEGEQIPEDWSTGVIVKVPEKGALRDCNNWRGITLLSVPSKIPAKIITNRMSDAVDSYLRKEQAGFRKERRCTDQIFALRNIIEQCTEWQRQLYVNFVDFEKAFDSVHRESLWYILRFY
ncbi:uncharacterized protein LOC101861615 [Aplysia californica]|uniref:Uncharacterized protein LOC101861615 n=1 Tax=Aplysia californica TaxID=6500 RepID=A0ABM1AA19_APLCA|nr:uncharacterized protein LOC101861615 [Aplysia californica]